MDGGCKDYPCKVVYMATCLFWMCFIPITAVCLIAHWVSP